MRRSFEPIHVLHVDDEPEFAAMTERFFDREDEQFSVETATDAKEARERLADEDFDCIVSDYGMPGPNGIEFLEIVREDYPDLPFILFTGKGSEEVASEAISAGVSDYLQKGSGPDQYAVLANRITNLVRQYRAERRLKNEAARRDRRERYRQKLLDLTADPTLTPEQKTEKLLELGCDRLGMTNGHLVKIDEECGRHKVIGTYGADIVREGVIDLSDTYCRKTISSDDILDVYDAIDQGWEKDPAYERFGLGSYIGKKLLVEDELYGTLCFVSKAPRDNPFSPDDKAFFELLSRWFNQLLERKRRRTQLQTMFEHNQDVVSLIDVTCDGEFKIRRVNRVCEQMTGYTTEDLKGHTLRELLGEEEGAARESNYRRCVEHREPIEYEEAVVIDDEPRYWQTKLAPVVEDDEVIQLVRTSRDITHRKERERELREQKEQFRELVVQVENYAIFKLDPEGGVVTWNRGAERIKGYSADEILGEHFSILYPDEASEAGKPERLLETAVEHGSVEDEDWRVRKDGSRFWAHVTITALERDGELHGFAKVTRDMTNRRQREQELERQNDRLEKFAGVLSHDLRNPLNVAANRLALARMECDSDDLDALERALDRMEALIEDLLALARQGKTVTDPSRIDLATLFERAGANIETAAATLVSDTDQVVLADEQRLQQLLENLIRNAVEHGGEQVTVTLGDLDDGFYVEDDGVGLPEDRRDEIFEAGYSTLEEGTGFGLSIVTEIAHAHGWSIRATDSPQGGARFELTGVETR